MNYIDEPYTEAGDKPNPVYTHRGMVISPGSLMSERRWLTLKAIRDLGIQDKPIDLSEFAAFEIKRRARVVARMFQTRMKLQFGGIA